MNSQCQFVNLLRILLQTDGLPPRCPLVHAEFALFPVHLTLYGAILILQKTVGVPVAVCSHHVFVAPPSDLVVPLIHFVRQDRHLQQLLLTRDRPILQLLNLCALSGRQQLFSRPAALLRQLVLQHLYIERADRLPPLLLLEVTILLLLPPLTRLVQILDLALETVQQHLKLSQQVLVCFVHAGHVLVPDLRAPQDGYDTTLLAVDKRERGHH